MDKKEFIKKKLDLLKVDNAKGFGSLAESLEDAVPGDEAIEIKADGNWFRAPFEALQIKEDRAVITAHRHL